VNTHNQIVPIEISKLDVGYGRVIRKHTIRGGIQVVTLHNGVNIRNAPNAKVGDTVVYSLKDGKLLSVIPLKEDANCMIIDGKHAGKLVVLNKITLVGANNRKEVYLKDMKSGKEIITIFDYLMAVDDNLTSEIRSGMGW